MNRHGDFIWYELITPDAAASGDFYGKVLGWTQHDAGMGAPGYRINMHRSEAVGGVMSDPAREMGPPRWIGYVAVDDVDAAVASVQAAGGSVTMPAMDVEGVGRLALLRDPQGGEFYVMRGTPDQTSTAFSHDDVGHCNWNELSTPDMPAALTFYREQFGWTKGDVMPMGPLGDYQFIDHGGKMLGAAMNTPPGMPGPIWTFYFGVPDIDTALSAVKTGGGTVTQEATEIPGGMFSAMASDPNGAHFGLVGPKAG